MSESRRELVAREEMARLLETIAEAVTDFKSAYEAQARKLDDMGYHVDDWDDLGFASLEIEDVRQQARAWRR